MNVKIEASRLFDKLYLEIEGNKVSRRKISETLNRIKTWFNKELQSNEIIPKEFNEYLQAYQYNSDSLLAQNASDILKMKYLWNKAL